jgi:uncharacterized membrane protein YeiH
MSSAATVYQTLNLIAITCAALAGSTAARRRGLDPVGVLCCACITGLGGGLLRDVLLQDGVPASIADPWNSAAAFAAGAVLRLASPRGAAWRILAPVAEAATIGAWAVPARRRRPPWALPPSRPSCWAWSARWAAARSATSWCSGAYRRFLVVTP